MANCPAGYYGDSSDFTCQPCTVGCALCNSLGNYSCTACKNDTNNNVYYKYFGADICSL